MNLVFVNLDTRQARAAANGTVQPAISATLLSPWTLDLHFHRAGAAVAADLTGAAMKLVIKTSPTSAPLLYRSFTASADEAGRVACVIDSLDSSTLRTALGDAKTLGAICEVEWAHDTWSGRAAWSMVVANAYIRPGDAAPLPAGNETELWLDARGVRHDKSQELSEESKQTALDNIGAAAAAALSNESTARQTADQELAEAIETISLTPGPPGTEIELRTNTTHVQWRYVGGAWGDLIALSAITGANGQEASFQVTVGNMLQWRLGAEAWQDLFDLETLATSSDLAETVPDIAQVTELNCSTVSGVSNMFGNLLDIPFDRAGHVLRVWFDDINNPYSEPATPPGSRIARVGLTGSEQDTDIASALAPVIDADPDLQASANGPIVTVTQPAGDLLPITGAAGINYTETVPGVDSYRRLAAINAELLTHVDAQTLQGYEPVHFAGASHTHNYLTDLYRRPACTWLLNDWTRNGNTLASVTGMSLPVLAGVPYIFEAEGFYTTSVNTEGLGLAMQGPSATGIVIESIICLAAAGTLNLARNTAWNTVHQATSSGGAVNQWWRIRGRFTPSADGNLELRAQTETTGNITLKGGAVMRLVPVG